MTDNTMVPSLINSAINDLLKRLARPREEVRHHQLLIDATQHIGHQIHEKNTLCVGTLNKEVPYD